MTIREIKISDYLPYMGSLFASQHEEMGEDVTIGLPLEPKPDLDRYAMLDEIGMTLALGVFEGSDLVGYSNSLISNSLHYKDLIVCQNDAIYVLPEHRKGGTGVKLIRRTERAAYLRGAHFVVWQCKPLSPLHSLMIRGNYQLQDLAYTKVLNGH